MPQIISLSSKVLILESRSTTFCILRIKKSEEEKKKKKKVSSFICHLISDQSIQYFKAHYHTCMYSFSALSFQFRTGEES